MPVIVMEAFSEKQDVSLAVVEVRTSSRNVSLRSVPTKLLERRIQIRIRGYLLASLSEQNLFSLLLLSEEVSDAHVIEVRRDIDQHAVLQCGLDVRINFRYKVIESCVIELFSRRAFNTMEDLSDLRDDLTHGTNAVIGLDLELAQRVVAAAIEQRVDVNIQRAAEDQCLAVILCVLI